jgi:hypothetical protein
MSGAISPLLQYAFMVWCSVKARELYLSPFTNDEMQTDRNKEPRTKDEAIRKLRSEQVNKRQFYEYDDDEIFCFEIIENTLSANRILPVL